jgi:hypothetical protein
MTSDTLLLRQVHPNFVQQGRVTSQVFRPTPKDEKQLSVYDGDQIAPENAWKHYTGASGFASVGVLAVNVAECKQLDLPAKPDPTPFPEHAIIDFTNVLPNQILIKAKKLLALAESRGWRYQAEKAS